MSTPGARRSWCQMHKIGLIASKSALTLLFVSKVMPAAAVTADLSQYRAIQFGTDLPAVAKQVGASASDAKVIHSRPALLQELEWRPRGLGPSPSPQAESVDRVVFSFYNGELYRIVINYDRYEIEGLTAEDMVNAISVTYGAARPTVPVKAAQDRYGDQQDAIARWQDPQYCFDLIRSAYGRGFSLIGVMTKLDSPAQAAMLEAKRLDDLEAPQREAVRVASEQEAARDKLEKARLLNKPRFRP
jgi:hypothetical protein